MLRIFGGSLFFVICLLEVHSQQDENVTTQWFGPIILTSDGLVLGKSATTVEGQVPYYAFQGIPYAEPPIGNLRFRAPVKKAKWLGRLNATQDKKQCLQLAIPPQGSEDCLYINVYTTSLLGAKLPVMVWIYGGGFYSGDSRYKTYGPDYILEKDVIFVSFNYRLGIFGFGSTGDSASPGNYGLKDQILALQWVQENIARFGGDPKKVTIFGQSAGSASVSYLLQTELTKDLFRAAIMQSGTSLCLWALDRRSRAAMFTVGKVLLLNTSNSTNLINGLRRVDSTTLQNVAFAVSISVTISDIRKGITFGPVVEDGVVYRYSDDELSRGRFHRKPVMLGVTSSEAIGVGQFIDLVRAYFEIYDNSVSRLAPTDLTKNQTKLALAGSEIKSFYFGSTNTIEKSNAVLQFLSDDLFNRPVRRTALDQSKYVPVYFYVFSYVGRNNTVKRGAGHADDNLYIFRTYPNTTLPLQDKITRSRMVTLWTNFAKYTNPTPLEKPLLQNIIWSPTKSRPDDLVYLDIDTNLTLRRNPFEKYMKFWDGIYEKYGDPPHDTY